MALTIHVDVVSAEESIFSGAVEFAVFPGEAGELGVLPHHTPLLTRVKPGVVKLKLPDQEAFQAVYISGGMLEVQPALITLLADTAIRAENLDEAKALEAKKLAEMALEQKHNEVNRAAVESELAQTIAQIQAINKYRKTSIH